jgi:hypothetical protein
VREGRVDFVDLSRLESFAGDPKQFVDGIHPLEPNTRRMIDRLVPVGERTSGELESRYALQ